MRDEIKPVVIGRVWRDPDCLGEPLAEQHRLADGQVVVRWRVDPESLRGPVWLQVLEEGTPIHQHPESKRPIDSNS